MHKLICLNAYSLQDTALSIVFRPYHLTVKINVKGWGVGEITFQLFFFLQFSSSSTLPISNLKAEDPEVWMFCFPLKGQTNNIHRMQIRCLLMQLYYSTAKNRKEKKNLKCSQWDFFVKYYCFPEKKKKILYS